MSSGITKIMDILKIRIHGRGGQGDLLAVTALEQGKNKLNL